MNLIYKKADISHSMSAYILANKNTNKAISIMMTEESVETLMDVLPCTKTQDKPTGFQMMPRSYEEEFFKEVN